MDFHQFALQDIDIYADLVCEVINDISHLDFDRSITAIDGVVVCGHKRSQHRDKQHEYRFASFMRSGMRAGACVPHSVLHTDHGVAS